MDEARKLRIIEQIIKTDDNELVVRIEALIGKSMQDNAAPKNFSDFAGTWAVEEANEISRIIEESRRITNPEDWK